MTQDALLTRTETPGEWRSAVSYELSAVGRELTDQFIPVLRWAAGQPEFFLRALQQRESRGEGRPAATE